MACFAGLSILKTSCPSTSSLPKVRLTRVKSWHQHIPCTLSSCFLFFLNHPHKMLFLFACPIPSLTNYQDCPPGLFLLYFVKTEGVSLEIYFGPSLNDRALILLEEICALKQYKCSMFYFWCGPHSYCRITHLDRLTFLRTKNRTKLRSNWAVRGTQTLPKQK